MSKKRKHSAPKGNTVWHATVEEATLAKKPHYNGFACGHGVHGDTKYNRNKEKRNWKRALTQEGASRGSFLLLPAIFHDGNRSDFFNKHPMKGSLQ